MEKSIAHLEEARQKIAEDERKDPEAEYRDEKERFRKIAEDRAKDQWARYRSPHERVEDFPGYQDWLKGCRNFSWPSYAKAHREQEVELEKSLNRYQKLVAELAARRVTAISAKPQEVTVEFECGYDVNISVIWEGVQVEMPADAFERYSKVGPDSWRQSSNSLVRCREENFRIELKPQMGDDFPSVLRQMKRNGADTLVVGVFNAAGATLDQVRSMFGGKQIITLEQIRKLLPCVHNSLQLIGQNQ